MQSSSRARHRRIHTGDRPFRCDEPMCGISFCRKSTLAKHQQSSHPQGSLPRRPAEDPPSDRFYGRISLTNESLNAQSMSTNLPNSSKPAAYGHKLDLTSVPSNESLPLRDVSKNRSHDCEQVHSTCRSYGGSSLLRGFQADRPAVTPATSVKKIINITPLSSEHWADVSYDFSISWQAYSPQGTPLGTVNVTRVALCGERLIPRDGSLPTLLQDPCVSHNVLRDARIGVLKLVVACGILPENPMSIFRYIVAISLPSGLPMTIVAGGWDLIPKYIAESEAQLFQHSLEA
ncbi:hypothetical protein N7499_004061 [Penicillium canescens]|nr:hypothetical protein N7499_004061 [Penicillium canescens]